MTSEYGPMLRAWILSSTKVVELQACTSRPPSRPCRTPRPYGRRTTSSDRRPGGPPWLERASLMSASSRRRRRASPSGRLRRCTLREASADVFLRSALRGSLGTSPCGTASRDLLPDDLRPWSWPSVDLRLVAAAYRASCRARRAAQPRWTSRIWPTFIRLGTPSGLSTRSTGVPSCEVRHVFFGKDAARETTPLLPWRPAILSPTWSLRLIAT